MFHFLAVYNHAFIRNLCYGMIRDNTLTIRLDLIERCDFFLSLITRNFGNNLKLLHCQGMSKVWRQTAREKSKKQFLLCSAKKKSKVKKIQFFSRIHMLRHIKTETSDSSKHN